MLDEATYEQKIGSVFRRILDAVDQLDPDVLDAETTGDMVTLTSALGEKCVVNTQRAVRQIWVAGKGQGIHFSYDEPADAWVDDKARGLELFAFVADVVEAITGERLEYR